MKRLIATAATAGLALTGLAAAAPAAGAADSAAKIAWQPCAARPGEMCGSLSVPLDYAHPHGKHIKIALAMLPHKSKHYQGVVLTNPGRPGASGLGLETIGSAVPNHVGDDYDWIGFDPRGIGSSRPALKCDPNYFIAPRVPYVPKGADAKAIEKAWLAKSKAYAEACKKNDKIGLLQHDKTTDTVADMESIRKALHQKQINYYGFSYGTYLGQVYSTLHPKQVRRIVLDSSVDPRGVWYKANLDQDVAFDKNARLWFAWVARYDGVYHLGKTEQDVQNKYYRLLDRLTKKPAVGKTGKLGPDEVSDVVQGAAYYRFGWLSIGKALSDMITKNDPTGLITAYGNATPQDRAATDNGYVGYDAVQCTDVQWPTNWATWQRDNSALNKKYPFLTWGNAWYNAPCLFWPAKAGSPVKINGSGVHDLLLIDETNDAATPYPGSLEVRKLFPHSSLLAEPGGATHADSLSGDLCVDDTVAAYLANGTLPKRTGTAGYGADAVCAPLPDPNPTVKSAHDLAAPDAPVRVHF